MIYNLPISYRLFIINEINEYNQKQNSNKDGKQELLNPSSELKEAALKHKNNSFKIPKNPLK